MSNYPFLTLSDIVERHELGKASTIPCGHWSMRPCAERRAAQLECSRCAMDVLYSAYVNFDTSLPPDPHCALCGGTGDAPTGVVEFGQVERWPCSCLDPSQEVPGLRLQVQTLQSEVERLRPRPGNSKAAEIEYEIRAWGCSCSDEKCNYCYVSEIVTECHRLEQLCNDFKLLFDGRADCTSEGDIEVAECGRYLVEQETEIYRLKDELEEERSESSCYLDAMRIAADALDMGDATSARLYLTEPEFADSTWDKKTVLSYNKMARLAFYHVVFDLEHYETDRALDLIFETFDDMFLAGRFDDANLLLQEFPLDDVCADVIVGVLTITLGAKDRLPYRPEFVQRARKFLSAHHSPEEVEGMLDGLE